MEILILIIIIFVYYGIRVAIERVCSFFRGDLKDKKHTSKQNSVVTEKRLERPYEQSNKPVIGRINLEELTELDKRILAKKKENQTTNFPSNKAQSHHTASCQNTTANINIFTSLKQYHTSVKRDFSNKDNRLKKVNWIQFKEYLEGNNVRYFWHFTDYSNLASIKHRGGLYSWKHCEENNINIPKAGGTSLSRKLDSRYKLEDFVRLSFCSNHPMVYRLKQEGYNLVLLRIKIDVAYLKDTLFSDMNATDNSHRHGPLLEDLKHIDINATREAFVARTSPNFRKHQAEVLVKSFVPLEYIENIDNPIQL